jgi:hypothetical protein
MASFQDWYLEREKSMELADALLENNSVTYLELRQAL